MSQIVGHENELLQRKLDELDGEPSIEELLRRDRICYKEVAAVHKVLPDDIELYRFIESLRPSPTIVDADDNSEEKREYRARIKRLKEQQANREYREMTRSIYSGKQSSNQMPTFGQEVRQLNRQVIAIVNTMITVGSAFAFGYFGVQLILSEADLDTPTKILTGLVLSTIVFFADIYFIIKNME